VGRATTRKTKEGNTVLVSAITRRQSHGGGISMSSGVAENKRMRRRVVKILKPLHACAVENVACPGYPDIEFVGGHLELKELAAWPKDPDAVVPVPDFTQDQRLWLKTRNEAGGCADILLKVKNDWFLLNGVEATMYLGRTWTREDIETSAWGFWYKKLYEKEFLMDIRRWLVP
jgi:hypothetical protein